MELLLFPRALRRSRHIAFPLKLHGYAVVPEVQICHACDSENPETIRTVSCVRTPKSFSSLGLGLNRKWLCAEHCLSLDLICHLQPDERPAPVLQPVSQPVPQPVSQPVPQPMSQPVPQPMSQTVSPRALEPVLQPCPLHVRQSKSATCQKPPSSLGFIWQTYRKGHGRVPRTWLHPHCVFVHGRFCVEAGGRPEQCQ